MIEDIRIQDVRIPDISNWNQSLPPPVVPTIPHTTTTIGTPIIQLPGCVEAHPDAKKNKNLIADDPNGTVTFCDGTAPSFNPIEYNPEEIILTSPKETPKTPVKKQPEAPPPPPQVPLPSSVPGTKVEGEPEQQCQWYKELLVSDPRCIEPTFTEKYLPPLDMVTTTASIAVVATSTAIFAKPVADLLLKVLKPTVKKVVKKIATLRGKKVKVESVMERREQQRIRSHAIRKLKGKE